MADTTELKTYVIEVESNLNKYAEDAIKAKKAASDLKAANEELGKSGATPEQMKVANAELKVRNDEYKKAEALLKNAVAVVKAETGSRKQLELAIRLGRQELGKMPEMYIREANSLRTIINPAYKEHIRKVAELTDMQIKYDQTIKDGRSNVGNYGQAIEGAFKDAGSKIMSMVGPTALVAAGISAATKLWEGMKEAIMSTTFAIDAMNISAGVAKQIFFDIAINGKVNLENIAKAWKIAGDMNKVRIEQYTIDYKLSNIQREINALMLEASDLSKSDEDRMALYLKVREKDKIQTDLETNAIKKRIEATRELFLMNKDEESFKLLLSLQMQLDAAYAKSDQSMRAVASQMGGIQKRMDQEREASYNKWMAEIDAMNKADEMAAAKRIADAARKKVEAEKAMADSKKILAKEIEDYKKFISDKQKEDAKDKEKKKQDILDHQEWERNKFLSNQEILISMKEANNEWLYSIERQRLEIQRRDEIANAEKTGADINLIEAKYSAIREQINRAEADAKIGLYADFAGNLATIFGKNTAIGKAAAIAETTINTYRSATAAYAALAGVPVVGPVLGIAAAAAAVAAGISNVKKILAVKIPGGDSGGSPPTAISSSQPAQRVFAQASGSSVLTQAQLSQSQLNAMPQQNMLTAADIANALKDIPAPVVTVEDINVKVKSMNKVSVRANI